MTVNEEIFTTVIRMETKQDIMLADLVDIKAKVSKLPCEVNTYKIKTIQKIVYGTVTIILLAFMANLVTPVRSAVIKIEKPSMNRTMIPEAKILIKHSKASDDKISKS